jgi:hypothetical protein
MLRQFEGSSSFVNDTGSASTSITMTEYGTVNKPPFLLANSSNAANDLDALA